MQSLLLQHILDSPILVYPIIFLAMAFEGDPFLFAIGFLVQQGLLNMGDVFFVVFAGVILGDLVWYWFGFRFHASPFFLNKWFHTISKPFDSHIAKYPFRAIFISKFIYGIHHALLMRAGVLGIDLKRLITYDIISSFCWIMIVGGLGYIAGSSFSVLARSFRFVEIGLLLGLVVFFFFEYGLVKLSRIKWW